MNLSLIPNTDREKIKSTGSQKKKKKERKKETKTKKKKKKPHKQTKKTQNHNSEICIKNLNAQ